MNPGDYISVRRGNRKTIIHESDKEACAKVLELFAGYADAIVWCRGNGRTVAVWT